MIFGIWIIVNLKDLCSFIRRNSNFPWVLDSLVNASWHTQSTSWCILKTHLAFAINDATFGATAVPGRAIINAGITYILRINRLETNKNKKKRTFPYDCLDQITISQYFFDDWPTTLQIFGGFSNNAWYACVYSNPIDFHDVFYWVNTFYFTFVGN